MMVMPALTHPSACLSLPARAAERPTHAELCRLSTSPAVFPENNAAGMSSCEALLVHLEMLAFVPIDCVLSFLFSRSIFDVKAFQVGRKWSERRICDFQNPHGTAVSEIRITIFGKRKVKIRRNDTSRARGYTRKYRENVTPATCKRKCTLKNKMRYHASTI